MFHSNSDKGFSLVEVLIVLGVIGLLLTVLVLSLNSKQTQIRDIKRLNDMNSLRDAMSVLKHETGVFDRAYCELGPVSACGRVENSRLRAYLPNLRNLNDPQTLDVNCSDAAACAAGACNYAFTKLESNDFEIRFSLEKGVNGYSAKGCYKLTSNGISKL